MQYTILPLCIMLPNSLFSTENGAVKTNPALEKFSGDISFYASLNGHAEADLSEGIGEPIEPMERGDEHWADGIFGKALKSEAPKIRYAPEGNVDLLGSGSVAFWVKALDWDSTLEPTHIGFLRVMEGNRELSLIRIWKHENHNALALHVKLRNSPHTQRIGSSKDWGNEWHLFVANWTRDYIEVSLDGNLLARQTVTEGDEDASYMRETPAIHIPGGGDVAEFPYLIDEVMFFKRPLTNEEVQWIYESAEPFVQ